MGQGFLVLLRDLAIERQHDADVMAFPCQNRCQCTNHVRQTARLDKRYAFTGGKQNLHRNITS